VSPALYADVVGQGRAVEQLVAAAAAPVHAYLLVGPPGSGKRAAARGFAASLLCRRGGCGECRDCRLALAGQHPDLVVVEPKGDRIRVVEGAEIIRLASLSPAEGARKVLVLTRFHRIESFGAMLLKTIEEPAESTVFVIVADDVPPELITIASRCVRVDFAPVPTALVVARLEAEGVAPEVARTAAEAAAGDVGRARLLASDPGLAARREAWHRLPERLDGTGAAVSVAVASLSELLDAAAAPLTARQAAEASELQERIERSGERGSGRKELEERHRREQRRLRADELRFGLATLARRYRDAVAGHPRPAEVLDGLRAIQAAAEALVRNPNEGLLLTALFLELPPLASAPPPAAQPDLG
jgi:DNA polymerase-3 subunit delta'